MNNWLKNNSLNASTETLSWASDTSSTSSGSSTIYESDIASDDEERFEENCIKKEDEHMKKSTKQILQQEREFHNLFERIKILFPDIIYPSFSSLHVREGFKQNINYFHGIFQEGVPPPAPLPWKIINFFPTIFQIFVLWYNRPETHFHWRAS